MSFDELYIFQKGFEITLPSHLIFSKMQQISELINIATLSGVATVDSYQNTPYHERKYGEDTHINDFEMKKIHVEKKFPISFSYIVRARKYLELYSEYLLCEFIIESLFS